MDFEVRVRLPLGSPFSKLGCSYNGSTLLSHGRNSGSIPERSTIFIAQGISSPFIVLKEKEMIMWIMEGGQKRRAEYYKCEVCHTPFARRINGDKRTCSPECCKVLRAKDKRLRIKCSNCGKDVERAKSKFVSRHGHFFCNRSCKEMAQSLSGSCDDIRPAHYGNGGGKHNSLSDPLLKKGCVDCGEKRRYLLALHHKDKNKLNGAISNLEVVCFNDHIKRHLRKNENGEWVFDTKALTPREILAAL